MKQQKIVYDCVNVNSAPGDGDCSWVSVSAYLQGREVFSQELTIPYDYEGEYPNNDANSWGIDGIEFVYRHEHTFK